jgi:hypothetical protein
VQPLFICHHTDREPRVRPFVDELRVRGIAPWVAQDGGFMIGDDQEAEARRVIRRECRGLLFYVTPGAIERDFIKRVELREALRRVSRERLLGLVGRAPAERFFIACVADGVGFDEIRVAGRRHVHHDLSRYAGAQLGLEDPPDHADAARRVLQQRLRNRPALRNAVSFQFSTRDRFDDEPADLLRIDAAPLLVADGSPEGWSRIAAGLRDIKAELSRWGRPALSVHGSRHLTSAFLLGATFRRSSGFPLSVRARDGWWQADGPLEPSNVNGHVDDGDDYEALAIQIAATDKDPTAAVDMFLAQTARRPRVLRISAPDHQHMTSAQGRHAAAAIRERVVAALQPQVPDRLLVFLSTPAGLATQIGFEWNGLPPTVLHEFDAPRYRATLTIES